MSEVKIKEEELAISLTSLEIGEISAIPIKTEEDASVQVMDEDIPRASVEADDDGNEPNAFYAYIKKHWRRIMKHERNFKEFVKDNLLAIEAHNYDLIVLTPDQLSAKVEAVETFMMTLSIANKKAARRARKSASRRIQLRRA